MQSIILTAFRIDSQQASFCTWLYLVTARKAMPFTDEQRNRYQFFVLPASYFKLLLRCLYSLTSQGL